MFKNRLLKLLGKASPEELKQFRSYMKNRYGRQKIANDLLAYLKDFYPEFDDPKLERKYAYKRLFKGENYKEKKLLNSLSDLHNFLLEFLLQEQLKKESSEKDRLLLRIYKNYQLDDFYFQQLQKMERKLEEDPGALPWYWEHKMSLAHELYFNPWTNRENNQNHKIGESLESLDLFHAAAKFRYACELYSRHQILQEPLPDIPFLEELMKKDWSKVSAYHGSYQLVLRLIRERKDDIYYQLKEMVMTRTEEFQARDLHILISYLINHTGFHIKSGKQEFTQEAFELYRFSVERELFITDGQFDARHFDNIVDIGRGLQEYDWLEQFVEDWSPYLAEDIREQTRLFSQAFIHFSKGTFDKALEILGTIKHPEMYNNVRLRLLEIATLYELEEDRNLILDRCNAAEKYARRNEQMHEKMRINVLNFLRIIRRLLEIEPDLSALQEQLENPGFPSYFKLWLLEKVSR